MSNPDRNQQIENNQLGTQRKAETHARNTNLKRKKKPETQPEITLKHKHKRRNPYRNRNTTQNPAQNLL